jgi:phosphatidylglycerophosphatase A
VKEMSFTDRLLYGYALAWPLGRLPKAPGTWGSAGAAVLAPFIFMPLPYVWRVVFMAVLFFIGIYAASKVEQILERKDPGCVVIDEVVAQWLVMAPFATLSWPMVGAAFVFFRIFDILKPWPVKQMELKFAGGLGVMIDDLFASVYALACMFALKYLISL